MPTYEYRCAACNKKFSVTTTVSEHDRKRPACPKCKSSRKVSQILSSFTVKTSRKS